MPGIWRARRRSETIDRLGESRFTFTAYDCDGQVQEDRFCRPPERSRRGEEGPTGARSPSEVCGRESAAVELGSGLIMEHATRTLLCSDLFADGGTDHPPLFEGDIFGPSEAFRRKLDFYTHTKETREMLGRLASLKPTTLARMHGSAWHGDGARLLLALADSLETNDYRTRPALPFRP